MLRNLSWGSRPTLDAKWVYSALSDLIRLGSYHNHNLSLDFIPKKHYLGIYLTKCMSPISHNALDSIKLLRAR